MEQNRANIYDAVIIGGGPAGLTAAIYLARAKYRVLVVEKDKLGGQIVITSDVVNYPGIVKTSGKKLIDDMAFQAEHFGTEFSFAEVIDMDLTGDIKKIKTTSGEYESLAVILATGANPRKVGFIGEKEFQGRGVAYCATCDGEFFTGMDIFVIGGGFAAVEESIFLTRYAKSITILVRKDKFSCAKTVADELKKYPKISVKFNSELVEAGGDPILTYAKFKNNQTGETWQYDAQKGTSFGVFVFAGYLPNTTLFKDKIELDASGYVKTDKEQKTNVAGVYAAGDLCIKNLRQVVTAVSDGAISATSAEKYISMMHDKLGLEEFQQLKADEKRLEERKEAIITSTEHGDDNTQFISNEIRAQLEPVFSKFEQNVIIKNHKNDSSLAAELINFADEFASLTDKISVIEEEIAEDKAPALEILRGDKTPAKILFHAVPGGHEFNSFVLAVYNSSGKGQPQDDNVKKAVAKVQENGKKINVKVMVSLSCTMCPEVVMGAARLATLTDEVTLEVFDIQHFPDIRQKYNIMSVPCIVVNDKDVTFGKKNILELSEIITR